MIDDEYIPSANDSYVVYERLFFKNDLGTVITLDGQEITDTAQAYFFNFYDWAISPTWVKEETTPHIIYPACGPILQLENRRYDRETIDHLNRIGLNIYLYELLMLSKESTRHTLKEYRLNENVGFGDMILDFVDNNLVNDFSNESDIKFYSYELDSIERFIKNNNLTNVNVYTCHYNIRKHLADQYPSMNLFCKDLFLASNIDFPEEDNYPYELLENPEQKIENKFLCPNWRYHPTRHLIMSYLINYSDNCSWYYKGDIDLLKKNLWFDLDLWRKTNPHAFRMIEQGDKKLNEKTPMTFDLFLEPKNIDGVFDMWKYPESYSSCPPNNRIDDVYEKSFCVIVTESVFAQPMAEFSEKTLNAIKLGRPFILVAPPYTLEYMHKYGFITFNDYWDESYDNEENHEFRLLKILKLIDFINDKSMSEIKEMYQSMDQILKHNISILETLKNKDPIFF